MANPNHLVLLRQGVEAWNAWREQEPTVKPDRSGADLRGSNLPDTNFSAEEFRDANLSETNLSRADFSGAKLRDTDLSRARLRAVNFKDADLNRADLSDSDLRGSDLRDTDLCDVNLRGADVRDAYISRAVWGLLHVSHETKQWDLVITEPGEPKGTTDDLAIAQFLGLLRNNEKIPRVIETITSTVVLILGRFSEERKVRLILDDRVSEPASPHRGLAVQDEGAAGIGDRHAAAAAERAAPPRSLETEIGGCRSTAIRLALSPVSIGVERCEDYPAGDDRPVASGGV
jgi:hypothetical protein